MANHYVAENIRFLRRKFNMSQDDLARRLGYSSYSTVQKWEDGSNNPNIKTILNLVDIFRVPLEPFVQEDLATYPKYRKKTFKSNTDFHHRNGVPIVGTIVAEAPILAKEHIKDYIYVDNSIDADFALIVKGDSMINAHILDGDIALIRQQEVLENGEICAVLVGNEATLKTFRKSGDDIIMLYPENSNYEPITIINGEDPYHDQEIRILGKFVGLFRKEDE